MKTCIACGSQIPLQAKRCSQPDCRENLIEWAFAEGMTHAELRVADPFLADLGSVQRRYQQLTQKPASAKRAEAAPLTPPVKGA